MIPKKRLIVGTSCFLPTAECGRQILRSQIRLGIDTVHDDDAGVDPNEIEANNFAVYLLIPTHLVIGRVETLGVAHFRTRA